MSELRNRKLRKLKNNPKLYFLDFFKKRVAAINNYIAIRKPRVKSSTKKYTIISAVYNVADYIDDFVLSLTKQRLDFESNIDLILVNDGSTDASRDKILKWVYRYPNNIRLINKENGGQASARNLGLNYVSTKWVTFVDPDDFLDVNYFYNINKVIDEETSCVITKFKLYKEKEKTYTDGFATDFCFSSELRVLSTKDLENCVQFSSSSSIYLSSIIKENLLEFEEKLTASFEDTKFFYDYLFCCPKSSIKWLKSALYYYRLRADESSSSNKQWSKKAKYNEFFEYGLKAVVGKYKDDRDRIPKYIQRMILFSIIPYLQVWMNDKNRIISVLTNVEVERLYNNIRYCLSFVDEIVIENFYDKPSNYFWISGLLNHFKNKSPAEARVYVNKIDTINRRINIRVYSNPDAKITITDSFGKRVRIYSVKEISHSIFDKLFVTEYSILCDISILPISVRLNDVQAKIFTDFRVAKELEDKDVELYRNKERSFIDKFVFIDSGYKADDNAEHLYRECCKDERFSCIDKYYILDVKSKHWERLKSEGFNLIDINSINAIRLLKKAKFIFASYLPGHYSTWLRGHTFKFQKYIFLQHGVVTSNLSRPFNAFYSQIFWTIHTTKLEHDEFLDNSQGYLLNQFDLVKSGIPRYQSLLKEDDSYQSNKEPTILVCPTWRLSLEKLNVHNKNYVNEFMSSDYVRSWIDLLVSKSIALANDRGYKIIFVPHPNFFKLIEENSVIKCDLEKKLPDFIKIMSPFEVSYQSLFKKSDILITDYSSLHFDFGVMRKQVIYYQFDKKEFYGKSHAYGKGLFDFEKHGFGPVFYDLVNINAYIKKLLNGSRIERVERDLFYKECNESCNVILNKVHELII